MSEMYQCRSVECDKEFESKEARESHEGQKHDIIKEYRDPELLRELYYGKGMIIEEIADELNASATTVRRYMERYDIDRRSIAKHQLPVHLRWKDGYRVWATKIQGQQKTVRVHRLVAVAEYGFEEVCDNIVHHKNRIRWDNRIENLEVMDHGDHMSEHIEQFERADSGRIIGRKG